MNLLKKAKDSDKSKEDKKKRFSEDSGSKKKSEENKAGKSTANVTIGSASTSGAKDVIKTGKKKDDEEIDKEESKSDEAILFMKLI